MKLLTTILMVIETAYTCIFLLISVTLLGKLNLFKLYVVLNCIVLHPLENGSASQDSTDDYT